jgi:hypothetical protein
MARVWRKSRPMRVHTFLPNVDECVDKQAICALC